MDTKVIVIIAFSYLYGFFEIFMSLRLRGKRTVVKTGDRLSIWVLVIFIALGYSLSFGIGATKIGRLNHWDTFFVTGTILVLMGLIIRIRSILALKQHFTYTVTKIENHELIKTGLYKSVRHPGYLGQLIIFAGIATSLSNWLSILLMLIPVLLGYIYRIRVEERFMVNQFGQKYIEYQGSTKRLIPMIY
jgi:protein-S-isoprenylcysteine O-methyltransferase Ste14